MAVLHTLNRVGVRSTELAANPGQSLMNCLGSSFQHSKKLRHVGLYLAEPALPYRKLTYGARTQYIAIGINSGV